VTKEYGVYYKRIPTSDGGYVMDHIAILYMMDPNGRFVGVIPYQEGTRCRSFASAINRLVDHIVVWRLLACSGSLPSPVEASAADFDLRFWEAAHK
jgi:hypothetical protein